MPQHQHHSAHSGAQSKTSPTQSVLGNMPAISEDDPTADADEPPDHRLQSFVKTMPPAGPVRRQSLLTRALHTDSESPEDDVNHHVYPFTRDPSRSSTCSTVSGRSMSDMASDDGQVSYQTRASTPSSPPAATYNIAKQGLPTRPKLGLPRLNTTNATESQGSAIFSPATLSEPSVEEELGRRRCISFVCGRKQTSETLKSPLDQEGKAEVEETRPEGPLKRPSMLKFNCPSRISVIEKPVDTTEARLTRYTSPPPPIKGSSAASAQRRAHRESDTAIKNESPKNERKVPTPRPQRRFSIDSDCGRTEATRFHEFASSDEEVADWAQESTVHRSRLTVEDTLQKEMRIRQLGAEAEAEALEEEDSDDLDDEELEDDSEQLSDDDVSEGGFQTDDEEGFAESDDDENDSGSDYEWWAPRRSPRSMSTVGPVESFRPSMRRRSSDASTNSDPSQHSPRNLSPHSKKHKHSRSVHIRPGTPDLPDSTDFVCGTLDEDRPLEQAYISCLKQRQAAKHRAIPQDIDPTFPQSDPEIDFDDDEEDEVTEHDVEESDVGIFPFAHATTHDKRDHTGGRARVTSAKRDSPSISPPKRRRSPPPIKHHKVLHSPPPRPLFGRSPSRRMRSPPPGGRRLVSPPPSRRASANGSPSAMVGTITMGNGIAFLGERPTLTHTSSLPRHSNATMCRDRRPSIAPAGINEDDELDEDDDDEDHRSGATTPNHDGVYDRGAIDIVQGLERKRLRRRQKFYEKYLRKEEKKGKQGQHKRPPPGKGAQRMRQVGIECAVYRGQRMLSI